jgi:hypothetical protein
MVLACLCVGDASSKCKEAGGAQDRIIHDGNEDEDGGSCRGPRSRTPWKGVVHAWAGQKLLNCFIFKCFTRKTLKNKSIGHR